jgi:type III pantothenate kinase
VVVDFGTATTFDCVGDDGAYLGGAIAPGLELGLEALAARTAKLPRIELRTPDRAIGRDTVGAMQSGTIFGYQALASGLLARIRAELAELTGADVESIQAILTGGLSAAPWARDIEGVSVIDPDLTLKGLAILYAEVAGGDPLEEGYA